MLTTVTIGDALHEKTLENASTNMYKSDIFREAIKTFVRVQAANRLAVLRLHDDYDSRRHPADYARNDHDVAGHVCPRF